ncbi:MAG: hypothetical protein EXS37_21510 [Opitutus sp.]|nr:hypothetical protein [Opitutus sp.]
MIPLRSAFAAIFLGAAVAWPAVPSQGGWFLPPLDGELSGEFNALVLGGAPKLNWKFALRTENLRERIVDFLIEGRGLRVQGGARLDPVGEGSWRITGATVDLGEWFGWLAPQFSTEAAGMSCAGSLELTGEGTWLGGVLGGRARFSLREGRIDDPAQKFLLEGISVDVEIADLATWRTELAQVFSWRSGRYDVVALGVGRIEFALDAEQVRVTKAAIDVFGGELNVGSLVMSTRRPEFSVIARMDGVAVDQILFLLPPVLSEAHGRMDGSVALRRDSTGIQIGNGRLALRAGETADLRLAVKPGWLSTSLPPAVIKYFPGFQKMETGEIPVRARVLEVTLTPLGDAEGRTAWVHLAGGPSDPTFTAPIQTDVNVRGPLEALVKIGAELGTNPRLRFGDTR